jgi:hypothetical protein
MLDFNHILSTPGVDVQYFTGQGGIIGPIASVTLVVGGVLTVTSSAASGGYLVGQAITVSGTLTAGTINGTADYTTPVTFYIIQVTSATSITISATPGGAAVTTTAGTATPGGVFTLSSQWQTWRKPRGVKNVYMIGVGGGSSGAVGDNAAATNVGGNGGGSGGQTCVWIPAFFVPDVLYVQCGAGGRQPTTLVSGQLQQGGGPTYVAIEPSTTLTANMTVLLANGGQAASVSGGVLATIAGMPLAARGFYTFFAGQAGTSGGFAGNGNGTALTFPTTGLMVMGGAGGGGGGNPTGGVGGSRSVPAGVPINDFFLPTQTGGIAAASATPAGAGGSGVIVRNFIMNYGGLGGGGASSASGGVAGAGGNGAPGSGGGGSGGSTTVAGANTLARPGNGGDGFVIIMSW